MSDIQEKMADILAGMQEFKDENERLKAVLESIKDQCIGEVAMGYRLDAESIGQQIHAAINP